MKLPAPMAVALQTGFNQYLALDEESLHKLDRFQGKLVKFESTVMSPDLYLYFQRDKVEVLEEFAATPDATIKGAPFSLLRLATGATGLAESGVEISGDVELAQQVSRLLQQIDVDWEEHISRITGDAVAHQLGSFARGFKQFVSRSGNNLSENTADYLRDESGQLPHDWELESFSDEVDDLRDRVDALALNVKLITGIDVNE